YLWTKKNGLESLAFEEAVRLEGRRPSPLPPERDYARPYDYLPRGRYDVFAERWLAALGRTRVLFALYEDLVTKPEPVLARIQAAAASARPGLWHRPQHAGAGRGVAAGDRDRRRSVRRQHRRRRIGAATARRRGSRRVHGGQLPGLPGRTVRRHRLGHGAVC